MFYRGEENQYKNNTTTATSIDSIIDKFLSADTIIQAPHDSQSYNRYSYVRNNPLVFTDPSGHSWLSKLWHHIKHAIRTIAAIVVAAVIAIYAPEFLGAYIHSAFGVTVATGALAGFASGGIMTGSLGGALKGALFGAISAGVAYGVAEVAGKLSGLGSLEGHTATLLKSGLNKLTAIKTMLHGLSRGIISKLQGGSFKAGFMSGLSSAFDIGTKAFGTGAGGFSMRTAVMAIVGGTASALGGGKFANGAISGAFVHMFNAENVLSLTKKFFSGVSGEYVFGSEDKMTQDLMNDPRLRRGIQLWKNTHPLDIGNKGFIDNGIFFPIEKGGLNLTLQFVGSYTASIYVTGNNEATIYIYNNTSWTSAFYHLIPDAISNNMNSIQQHYWWTEPLR